MQQNISLFLVDIFQQSRVILHWLYIFWWSGHLSICSNWRIPIRVSIRILTKSASIPAKLIENENKPYYCIFRLRAINISLKRSRRTSTSTRTYPRHLAFRLPSLNAPCFSIIIFFYAWLVRLHVFLSTHCEWSLNMHFFKVVTRSFSDPLILHTSW